MTITFASYTVSRKRVISFTILALAALLGVGVFLWSRTPTSEVTLAKDDVCVLTTVSVGEYEMPAFNTASYRVMANRLEDTNFKPRCAVDAPLELHYTMRFDAQKINWQAELVAFDEKGKEIWRGVENAAIQNVGAFQYTTESVAERLLEQFLATR
jgi:lipopolysaccharide export system protein LptC